MLEEDQYHNMISEMWQPERVCSLRSTVEPLLPLLVYSLCVGVVLQPFVSVDNQVLIPLYPHRVKMVHVLICLKQVSIFLVYFTFRSR